jgi:hypothetical protein
MALPIVETPKYEMIIPSTGKSVEYRPYLVKEEKILVMAMESKDSTSMIRAIRDVIESCTFKAVNPNNLTMFDLEFIFLKLRAVSVGAMAHIKIKCDNKQAKCEVYHELELDLDTVAVQGKIEKEHKVPLNETIGVILKYPTVMGSLTTSKMGDDENSYNMILATIISCIDVIYDNDNMHYAKDSTNAELQDFVESLNQEQFKKLNEFFSDMPQLKHDITFTCLGCGKENEKTIKGLQSFF